VPAGTGLADITAVVDSVYSTDQTTPSVPIPAGTTIQMSGADLTNFQVIGQVAVADDVHKDVPAAPPRPASKPKRRRTPFDPKAKAETAAKLAKWHADTLPHPPSSK